MPVSEKKSSDQNSGERNIIISDTIWTWPEKGRKILNGIDLEKIRGIPFENYPLKNTQRSIWSWKEVENKVSCKALYGRQQHLVLGDFHDHLCPKVHPTVPGLCREELAVMHFQGSRNIIGVLETGSLWDSHWDTEVVGRGGRDEGFWAQSLLEGKFWWGIVCCCCLFQLWI